VAIAISDLLDRLKSWPTKDIEELDGYAREIEARRTGVYQLTEDERAAIREGVEQADRGKFVSDEAVETFWKRCGVR
jgi:hypothetical protein